MENKANITVLAVGDTIQIFYNGDQLNIQKKTSPELFEKIFQLAKEQKHQEIADQYVDIKKAIESYTDGTFTVESNQLRLKGSKEVMPQMIAKKLLQLKAADADYMPLVMFWRKLMKNPDKAVREQLYGFMLHNNIPLTEIGDILVEKGVTVKKDGSLTDCHSRKYDNSIGMVVEMPREDCDSDPNRTCSHGLHVAAPDYVRNNWSSGTIVECIVDPKDFVAVPRDYNNTKARVCRYKVVGIASGAPQKNLIANWDDIIDAPTFANLADQNTPENLKHNNMSSSKQADTKDAYRELPQEAIDFAKMTAGKIKEYIAENYNGQLVLNTKGVEINNKNKAGIVAAANRIVADGGNQAQALLIEHKAEVNKKDFTEMSAKEIIAEVKKDFKKVIGGKSPRRARVLAQAIKMYAERDTRVVG